MSAKSAVLLDTINIDDSAFRTDIIYNQQSLKSTENVWDASSSDLRLDVSKADQVRNIPKASAIPVLRESHVKIDSLEIAHDNAISNVELAVDEDTLEPIQHSIFQCDHRHMANDVPISDQVFLIFDNSMYGTHFLCFCFTSSPCDDPFNKLNGTPGAKSFAYRVARNARLCSGRPTFQ